MRINFNKIFLLPTILFLLASCSTKSIIIHPDDAHFNTPFINASETTQLDFGLSKDEVLDMLGEPLYVTRGVGSSKTITWIYEVRAIRVKYEENAYLSNEAYVVIDNKVVKSILKVEDIDVLEEEVARKIEEYMDLPSNSISASNVDISKDVVRIKLTDLNPSKWNKIQKHTAPLHQLELEFVDDSLENWHEYSPEDSNNSSDDDDVNFSNYLHYLLFVKRTK